MKLGILASHPVQYYTPIYRELACHCELHVFYAYKPSAEQQGRDGFGVAFEWDTDLLSGYSYTVLQNLAKTPDVAQFSGCDTPHIAAKIREGGFDAFMVTGWNLWCYWQALRACKRNNVPVFVRGDSQLGTIRPWYKKILKSVAYPTLLRAFDGFCFVGQRNREYLNHYGVPDEKMFFSPHCVDVRQFTERAFSVVEPAAAPRAMLGVSPGEMLVLFVGKLIPRKRAHLLIEAVASLTQKGRPIHLALVGSGSEELGLRQLAKDRQISVTFAGFRNQSVLPALYANADVLALPSDDSETWGLVVNEAFACGTPAVVAIEAGCVPDLIDPGLTGEVFANGDSMQLSMALARVLERGKTQEVRLSLMQACLAYSVEKAAKGILDAAQQLSNRHE